VPSWETRRPRGEQAAAEERCIFEHGSSAAVGADPQNPPVSPRHRGTLTLLSVGVREILHWNWRRVSGGAGGRELGLLGGQARNAGVVKGKKIKLLMAMQFPARAPAGRTSADPFRTGMRPARTLVFSGHLLLSTQGPAKQNPKKSTFHRITEW